MPQVVSAHNIEIAYLLEDLKQQRVNFTGLDRSTRQFISAIEKGESRTAQDMQQQLEVLLALIPDDGVGLRAGGRVGVKDYGAFGHAYLSSRNMRAVHELILTYRRILRTIHGVSIEYGRRSFSYSMINLQASGAVKRFLIDAWLMGQYNGIRSLLGRKVGFETVRLAFDPPEYSDLYEETFCCPVSFGHEISSYTASNKLLDQPFSYANEDVRAFCEQQCLQILRSMDAGEETVTQARELLLRSPGWFPNCDELAAKMGFSARTLRRRLQKDGSSFQEVIDSVRKELSTNYLRTTDMTVEMIAFRLGYEEANSFYKAFRRWYGTSPKAFSERVQLR